ncbi:MAG: hypothetical protein GY854_14670 [Deltaproteobacteria bacterium]|nr:hypothetical protein [Deltaproteobacteria bacterium]
MKKMPKNWIWSIAIAIVVCATGIAMAEETIYLNKKNPNDWSYILDGSWGELTYNKAGDETTFAFKGQGLTPNTEYTLIYYPDPAPGDGLICIGSAKADATGEVNLGGVVTGTLPRSYDENNGAKFWLAPSSDLDCAAQKFIDVNYDKYLFENTRPVLH